jgi:hypothetical protein
LFRQKWPNSDHFLKCFIKVTKLANTALKIYSN